MKTVIALMIAISIGWSQACFAKFSVKFHQKNNQASYVYGKKQLANALDRITQINPLQTQIGVYVKSMKDGDTLYAKNINKAMVPASTLKIFTAEASLIFLGPDYRFSTQLLTDAKEIKNGVLKGNLYIILSGDPTLTYYDLIDLFQSLKSKQIHSIQGNVYIDQSAYDKRFYGPGWDAEDKAYCYAAPISASIINKNCLLLKVNSSQKIGNKAEIVTYPKYFYPNVKNSVQTKSKAARACSPQLLPYPNNILSVEGCIAKGRDWSTSYVVSNVTEYNQDLFQKLLRRMNIKVYGNIQFGSSNNKLLMIGTHSSEPLRVLINDMMKKSDNIIAGALFKKIGQLFTRHPGSWENGRVAVSSILSNKIGLYTAGLKILDGSGLSPYNRATPIQMMKILDFAYHHYQTGYDFISSLPIAGMDGTLKHRMNHLSGKIRAKTGTISGVTSLVGYAITKNKETLAFVIMINTDKNMNWQYKAMEDKIVSALTRYVKMN